jgi:hypothetical protein
LEKIGVIIILQQQKDFQVKKDLDQMSKIELLEYSKRARYMLGKVYSERVQLEQELAETKIELLKLKKQIAKDTK